MRSPGVYDPAKYVDPLDRRLVQIIKRRRHRGRAAVNLLGIPFDGAVLGRKGASGGPNGIRESLSSFSNYNFELGVGLEDARIFDLGDLVVDPNDVRKAHFSIEADLGKELANESLLVILGGDNSISLPALKAFSRKFGEIGLIVIDSHLDLRGKIGGKPTSGSSYGLAIQEAPGLDPHRIVEIGIHGFLSSGKYFDKARNLGISIFSTSDLREKGLLLVAEKAYTIARKGAKAVYLSVDMDVVDAGSVSGVSAPSFAGMSPWELFELVRFFTGKPEVRCADIVETAPPLDPTGRTQLVAATALTYMIGGFQSRKKPVKKRLKG